MKHKSKNIGKVLMVDDDLDVLDAARLFLKRNFSQGLLLPQVATENNWTLHEFLSHTAMKAGLSPDAWKDSNTEIFKFQADIFDQSIMRK